MTILIAFHANQYRNFKSYYLEQVTQQLGQAFPKLPSYQRFLSGFLRRCCLFVFTSSKHRKEATLACNEVVERIKNELPVWGKEIFEDETHQWKINQ